MERIAFGATGLEVSVAGLGCGGSSRLGAARGMSVDHSVALVLRAFDLGVTFFDTAQAYDTEEIVGRAMAQLPRGTCVISTKAQAVRDGAVLDADAVVASLDHSLRALGTECIDVFNLHALRPGDYDAVMDRVVPALLRERDKGKFRVLGVTEAGPFDTGHEMLARAVPDGSFGAVSIACNMMNQSAFHGVLPKCRALGVGTSAMFAVRAVFSQPGRLRAEVRRRVATGILPQWMADGDGPLDFLLHPGGAHSLTDAAYRYVRHRGGIDVVLFGTGDPDHLAANVASILRPALPVADVARLDELFAHLVGFGVDLPEPS